MEIMCKAAGVAIVGAALGLLLKKNEPALAYTLAAAVTGTVLLLALGMIESAAGSATELAEAAGISAAELITVLRALGISVITRIASGLCSDAGNSAAASAVQICGAAAIIFVSLPLMKTVMAEIGGML